MRIKTINTHGKLRKLYVPSFKEKAALKQLLPAMLQRQTAADRFSIMHGFTNKRSSVTNALAHINRQHTISFDFKDFFGSITAQHLNGKLPQEIISQIVVDGAPQQGLPTSPTAANIAASSFDEAVMRWIEKNDKDVIYTRYADDLTFSCDKIETIKCLETAIPRIAGKCAFKINTKKTKIQHASAGRRIITGVAVDSEVHPTRRTKRRLRAALHQNNVNQANGLAEWAKCKLPVDRTSQRRQDDQFKALCKHWRLPVIKTIPKKEPDQDLGDNCFITSDPVYMMGMSTLTNGWTSCLRQPSGSNRRSVLTWMQLQGTRIAVVLSDKTITVCGIERRVIITRCLVHELRNGQRVYDRLYGHDKEILEKKLIQFGYISAHAARTMNQGDLRVVGHVVNKPKTYVDTLRIINKPSYSEFTLSL